MFLLYLQTQHYPGKACKGQTLWLIIKIHKLRPKKVFKTYCVPSYVRQAQSYQQILEMPAKNTCQASTLAYSSLKKLSQWFFF
jgi:hypothetical protein